MVASFRVAPVYSTRLVREGGIKCSRQLTTPEAAAEVARTFLVDFPNESFLVIMLNTKNRVLGVVEVTRGLLDASLVHPREAFRPAILANAASIILAHNHPSGDTSPSREDYAVTDRLTSAGKILGIEVLDHIVIAEDEWFSIRAKERHYFKSSAAEEFCESLAA